MTKVLFLIDTLRGGGAEKVLVNLVNNMDYSKYDITVETLFDGGVNQKRLTDKVHYFCRKAPYPRGIGYIFSCFSSKQLYKYFIGNTHYDVIIAFMHGAATKIIDGCTDKNTKKITWLHTGNPESSSMFSFWFSKKAAFKAYSDCDAVVGISKSVADAFSKYTNIYNNIHIVYNTNESDKIQKLSNDEYSFPFEQNGTIISTVGRTSYEKGYDRLITAAKRLKGENYIFDIIIVGQGDKFNELQQQLNEFDLTDSVHMIGALDNPYPVVAKSDFFVCSSRQEGLSTAVSEAIILGKPVISTDVSGAKEILGKNNEFGLVVDNSEIGIYLGIKTFLDNNKVQHRYCDAAKRRADFFSTQNTVKQAQDLIDKILIN